MSKKTTHIIPCEHCGNRTPHTEKGAVRQNSDPNQFESTFTGMFLCSTCDGISLQKYDLHPYRDEWGEEEYSYDNWTTLYPSSSRLTELPTDIQKHYQRALKVKNIEPASFAVMAGRTLEAMCREQKAEGRNLEQKIKDLVKKEKIAPVFAKMADQIRILRNLGAHPDEDGDDVSEADAQTLFNFLEVLLEYVYVVERKVLALEKRLTRLPNPVVSKTDK